MGGFRREGVVEELFEVPAEFGHQVGVGAVGDGPLVGRGEDDGVGGFVFESDGEAGGVMIDDQGEGGHLRAVYQMVGRVNAGIWAKSVASTFPIST